MYNTILLSKVNLLFSKESNSVAIGLKQDSEVDDEMDNIAPKHHNMNNIILEQDDDSSSSCENKMIILHDENV